MFTSLRARSAVALLLLLSSCIILTSGCRPGGSSDDSKPKAPAAPIEIDVETLPPLGEDLPPLEGGSLLLAPPEGWNPAPRTGANLIRFHRANGRQGYPFILISWEETDLAEKLTEENALELAESFIESEEAEITPVIGDNNVVLLWKEKQGTDNDKRPGALVERMVAVVIAQGQLYRLEYRNWQDEMANEEFSDREILLAVAEGLRFPLEPQPEEPSVEDPEEGEEPAVTDPPEEVDPEDMPEDPPEEPDEEEPDPEESEPDETPDEEDDGTGTDLDDLLDSLNRP